MNLVINCFMQVVTLTAAGLAAVAVVDALVFFFREVMR